MASAADFELACPACRTVLTNQDGRITCSGCGRHFETEDGIPVLAVAEEGLGQGQAKYFDESVDREFEIERPRGLPRLYGWLLQEKFRRSVAGLDLRGASVLIVCGGSGMDAEFLAGTGARVMSSDLSLGAARRARERARRHGIAFETVVADARFLPFRDRSVDIVYVHDGLHHLEDPYAGLREVARVARRAVCVSEPAQALATSLAIKVGLAEDREDAGNRVARVAVPEVTATLESLGLEITRAERYAMFYRHKPGWAMQILSAPILLPVAKVGFRLGTALIGRVGNKLVVQAAVG